VEAAQDSLLTKGHESDADSPERAHKPPESYRSEQKANGVRVALREDAREEEEKTEGHDQAKKTKCFIAQGEAHAHVREREKVLQSRSLLPVSSMKTSSRDGVAISRLYEFVALRFDSV